MNMPSRYDQYGEDVKADLDIAIDSVKMAMEMVGRLFERMARMDNSDIDFAMGLWYSYLSEEVLRTLAAAESLCATLLRHDELKDSLDDAPMMAMLATLARASLEGEELEDWQRLDSACIRTVKAMRRVGSNLKSQGFDMPGFPSGLDDE